MFKIKAGTKIQVFMPFGSIKNTKSTVVKDGVAYTDTAPWKGYTTKEDKIYDKHEVIDYVAYHNGRGDIPEWAAFNLTHFNKTIVVRNGKYAMLDPTDIEYLD